MQSDQSGAQAVDLTNCDREPIHQLGLIQPFGCLFAFSSDWFVVHVSQNVSQFVDRSADAILDVQATEFMQADAIHAIRTRLQWLQHSDQAERLFSVPLFADSRPYDVSVHRAGGLIVVEIEPAGGGDRLDVVAIVRSMIARLAKTGGTREFLEMAARQLRFITGFDRIMIYRFLEDGSGEVIAEEKNDSAEPFLGLRYPASDIPKQARELYKRNLIRLIADVNAEDVAIVPAADPQGHVPDLSMSTLRSVSRIHVEYLRNMGVGASMSASILVDGDLWGLFACHHNSPKLLSFDQRTAIELFAQMFSLEFANRENRELAEADARAAAVHSRLLTSMTQEGDVFDRLSSRLAEFRSVVPCDGIGIWIDGRYSLAGCGVNAEEMLGLVRFLNRTHASEPYATNELVRHYPQAEAFADRAAGILAIPISRSPRDYLVFFRSEITRSVKWAGDPNKPVTVGPNGGRLTPRKSFQAWQEIVAGQSSAWRPSEIRIAESLRITLIEIFLRHADSTEQFRRQAQQKQDLLISELNHRVRNILGLVRGIVSQTESSVHSVEQFTKVLGGRIHALARAHDQLTAQSWGPASFQQLVETELAAYLGTGSDRVRLNGSDIILQPEAFTCAALVVHELVTNSVKYGALSNDTGRIDLDWRLDDIGDLEIKWSESGGPAVAAPLRRGFGSTIIERSIPFELDGQAEVEFALTGLRARFVIPANFVTEPGARAQYQNQRSAPPAAAAAEPLENVRGTILLVEDSIIIAVDAQHALNDLGFEKTIVAGNVTAAMKAIEENEISAALLDVNLGSQTSLPIAEELLRRGVPFVFATGYGQDIDLPEHMRSAQVITKPFDIHDLASAFGRI